jgi:hypothetical protein
MTESDWIEIPRRSSLLNPAIKSRLAEVGTIPMILTAAEFGAYVAAESEKWAKVVKFAAMAGRCARLTWAGALAVPSARRPRRRRPI